MTPARSPRSTPLSPEGARRGKRGTSPTQRTLKAAKAMGFVCAIVERWNQHARVRQDLFGCIDLILCYRGVGILGVQACAGASHAARRDKAIAEPRLRAWLESGGRFEVWSWSQRGERGKRKLWTLRRDEIVLDDLPLAERGAE